MCIKRISAIDRAFVASESIIFIRGGRLGHGQEEKVKLVMVMKNRGTSSNVLFGGVPRWMGDG